MGIDVSSPGGTAPNKDKEQYAQEYRELSAQDKVSIFNNASGFSTSTGGIEHIISLGSVLESSSFPVSDLADMIAENSFNIPKSVFLAERTELSANKLVDAITSALSDNQISKSQAEEFIYDGGFTNPNTALANVDYRFAYALYNFGDYDSWSTESSRGTYLKAGIGGDYDTVWFSLDDSFSGRIFELNPEDFSVVREVYTPSGDRYWDVGGDTSVVFGNNIDNNNIDVLDPSTMNVTNTVSTGSLPGSYDDTNAGVGGDSNTLWYVNGSDDDIHELDPDTLAVRNSTTLSPDEAFIGVGGTSNTVWAVDGSGTINYYDDQMILQDTGSVPGFSQSNTDSMKVGGPDDAIYCRIERDRIASIGGV